MSRSNTCALLLYVPYSRIQEIIQIDFRIEVMHSLHYLGCLSFLRSGLFITLLVWHLLVLIVPCISQLSHCRNAMPDALNLKEEKFNSASGLGAFSPWWALSKAETSWWKGWWSKGIWFIVAGSRAGKHCQRGRNEGPDTKTTLPAPTQTYPEVHSTKPQADLKANQVDIVPLSTTSHCTVQLRVGRTVETVFRVQAPETDCWPHCIYFILHLS